MTKRSVALTLFALAAMGCQESTTTGPGTSAPPAGMSNTGTATNPSATGASNTAKDLKKLTVIAKESQSIQQGDEDKVLVTINRDNFNDAVSLRIDNLPKGVTVEESAPSIAAGDNTMTLTLKADGSAPVGEYPVKLVAEAPGIETNTQTFTLKVTANQ